MEPSGMRVRRGLLAAVAVLAAATLLIVALTWPRGEAPDLGTQPNTYVDATIERVDHTRCQTFEAAGAFTDCQLASVRLTSGPDDGGAAQFTVRGTELGVPTLDVGERVVLLDLRGGPAEYRYVFTDFQRNTPMWGLLALFVVVVVAFAGWKGVRALVGLAASALVVLLYVVPSLLRNEPAVTVALGGTVVIAFLALYLAHGVNMATTVALCGTMASLALTVLLAVAVASMAHLSGLSGDEAQVLRVTASGLDPRGLLVAGVVIGALGVLDDVTVTQVSTVQVLARADPTAPRAATIRAALAVGRDHVASTVNTLILAYVGAALPLVLLFSQGSKPIGRILTSEVVAVEIVRMLTGSIGLVLSVPITTVLAAVVLRPDDPVGHDHHHGHDSRPGGGAAVLERHGPSWDDFAPEH